ncbi:MAG: histidine--tRNA ligase [Planctomycetota bacterium]
MAGTVEPRILRGLRDLFSERMHARQWIIDTVRAVYERYGFVPLGTPALEYLDVLRGTAGEESEKQLFEVTGPENEKLGLRFDQTVALARVVAQYPDLPRPYRRYQVAPVWRCDNPYEKRGRFREFIQFDIDSVGVESEAADLEMITAMCDVMEALLGWEGGEVRRWEGEGEAPAEPQSARRASDKRAGEGEAPAAPRASASAPGASATGGRRYRVRVSSRRVLNLLMPFAGIPQEKAHDVFRVLDKLDKLGHEKVQLELTTGYKDESGSPVPGLGFTDKQVARIDQFLAIRAPTRDATLAQVRRLFDGVPGAEAELDPLARMSRQLAALGYGDDQVVYDFTVARGLEYYTGTVFETELRDLPEFGSVCSGGRYDDLVMRFLGERVPAVGTSVGVDRLLVALTELGRIPPAASKKATAQVLVTVFDHEMMDDYLAMVYELRRAGINAELYLGTEKRVGKQVRYGDHYAIPVLVVCGSDERARGEVQLKDMSVGRQMTEKVADRKDWKAARPGQFNVPRGELVSAVRKLLAEVGVP